MSYSSEKTPIQKILETFETKEIKLKYDVIKNNNQFPSYLEKFLSKEPLKIQKYIDFIEEFKKIEKLIKKTKDLTIKEEIIKNLISLFEERKIEQRSSYFGVVDEFFTTSKTYDLKKQSFIEKEKTDELVKIENLIDYEKRYSLSDRYSLVLVEDKKAVFVTDENMYYTIPFIYLYHMEDMYNVKTNCKKNMTFYEPFLEKHQEHLNLISDLFDCFKYSKKHFDTLLNVMLDNVKYEIPFVTLPNNGTLLEFYTVEVSNLKDEMYKKVISIEHPFTNTYSSDIEEMLKSIDDYSYIRYRNILSSLPVNKFTTSLLKQVVKKNDYELHTFTLLNFILSFEKDDIKCFINESYKKTFTKYTDKERYRSLVYCPIQEAINILEKLPFSKELLLKIKDDLFENKSCEEFKEEHILKHTFHMFMQTKDGNYLREKDFKRLVLS